MASFSFVRNSLKGEVAVSFDIQHACRSNVWLTSMTVEMTQKRGVQVTFTYRWGHCDYTVQFSPLELDETSKESLRKLLRSLGYKPQPCWEYSARYRDAALIVM